MVTSLRTRIFLLIAALLVLVAAFVMLITQRAVTDTVYGSEERAAANALRLVSLDIDARYAQLLREKIATVRSYRAQLESHGNTVESTLNSFAALARAGVIDQAAAQRIALDWINELHATDNVQVMVYDRSLRVLAHPQAGFRGISLDLLRDLKGRAIAADMYRGTGVPLFGVYPWPSATKGEIDTHFGYFRRFAAWDWVFVVGSEAGAVERAVAEKRKEIVTALGDTLNRLTLAQSGFAFVFAGNGDMVVAPPARAAALLTAHDAASGQPLRDMLKRLGEDATGATRASFTQPGKDGGVWELYAAYVKPLDWYVAGAVPRSDLMEPGRALLRQQGAVFLAMLGVALLLAWAYASRLIRPLKILTRYARELPDRDLTAPHRVPPAVAELPTRYRDEVGRLATTLLYMEQQLRGNVARLMSETSARERIESELSIARDIQLGLLPIHLVPQVTKRVDLFATMTAAKEVGGDLYDYFMLGDGRLCFVIGDVSGKGVPAAMFMAITRTLVRSAARDESSAGTLMAVINDRLAEHNPNMMFVTLFVGILDLDTGALQYANAGHPPLWLLDDGRVRLLDGRSGPACGVVEDMPYAEFDTVLAPGTMLIGYTDGVTEADSTDGSFYGDDRGIRLLESLPAGSSSQVAAEALHADVVAFANGAEQADDITLIVVRRHPSDETLP
jgi:sigma-B regulation protein RsbU (phosphoserine phosphatase)